MPDIIIPQIGDAESALAAEPALLAAQASLTEAQAALEDAWLAWGVFAIGKAIDDCPLLPAVGIPMRPDLLLHAAPSARLRLHAGMDCLDNPQRMLTFKNNAERIKGRPRGHARDIRKAEAIFLRWAGDPRFQAFFRAALHAFKDRSCGLPMVWLVKTPHGAADGPERSSAERIFAALGREDLWATSVRAQPRTSTKSVSPAGMPQRI